jgi:hypothetical protein
LTQKQYVHVQKLLKADKDDGGDGTHLRNGILGIDINIPKYSYNIQVHEFGENHKEYLRDIIWLKDGDSNIKFSLDDIKTWWGVDSDSVLYNNEENRYGANSTIDVGMGAGLTKDNYAVIVRGGTKLDLLQGTTGIDTDNKNSTNGIGFRAATPYLK